MSKAEISWPQPTSVDEAISTGMSLAMHYGKTFSKIVLEEPVEEKPMTDREAEEALLHLADGIMEGTVNSHKQIARVIRSLGSKMGPLGSVTTEIDLALFRVGHSITQKQGAFVK